jgi:hypothetical protein
VSDTSDMGVWPFFNRSLLAAFAGGEDVVRMVFNYVIVDMAPFRATLGTRLIVNVRHVLLSLGTLAGNPSQRPGFAQQKIFQDILAVAGSKRRTANPAC